MPGGAEEREDGKTLFAELCRAAALSTTEGPAFTSHLLTQWQCSDIRVVLGISWIHLKTEE